MGQKGISLAIVTLCLGLSACSVSKSYFGSHSKYYSVLEDKIVTARHFVDAKQRLSIKALNAGPELKKLQEEVAPNFSFAHRPTNSQVIVAVTSQNRVPFTSVDLEFQFLLVELLDVFPSLLKQMLYSLWLHLGTSSIYSTSNGAKSVLSRACHPGG